jgi:hypothetical protein
MESDGIKKIIGLAKNGLFKINLVIYVVRSPIHIFTIRRLKQEGEEDIEKYHDLPAT